MPATTGDPRADSLGKSMAQLFLAKEETVPGAQHSMNIFQVQALLRTIKRYKCPSCTEGLQTPAGTTATDLCPHSHAEWHAQHCLQSMLPAKDVLSGIFYISVFRVPL